VIPMESTSSRHSATGAARGTTVPSSRIVPSLADALSLIRRFGGSVMSETRTAPGIGSWALVTDARGNDLVLWENAAQA
jgi:predicted enzyme related to lactoylglutathione lyase